MNTNDNHFSFVSHTLTPSLCVVSVITTSCPSHSLLLMCYFYEVSTSTANLLVFVHALCIIINFLSLNTQITFSTKSSKLILSCVPCTVYIALRRGKIVDWGFAWQKFLI